MSSVPSKAQPTPAQMRAQGDALRLLQGVSEHRATLRALQGSRVGMCTRDGWIVSHEQIDGDFDLDSSVVAELMRGGGGQGGPQMHAAPTPRPLPPAGPSLVQQYLNMPSPTAPAGTADRFGQELPGAVYGPGNLLGNSSAALAGSLQGLGERTGRRAMEAGVRSILAGQTQRVALGTGIELYNAAARGQRPRVRLRVRGLPVTQVRAMVPTSGGPVTQWRVGGAGTTASLKVQGMTAQQLRNTAIMASESRLPGALRWTGGKVGGGVLAFAPSAALDAYNAVETDLQGNRSFNGRQFLVDSAKSQSGNAVGFGAGMVVTGVAVVVGGAAAAASAPVIILALGVGLVAQVIWNGTGMADKAGQAAAEQLAR